MQTYPAHAGRQTTHTQTTKTWHADTSHHFALWDESTFFSPESRLPTRARHGEILLFTS
jgi:hypothetical protein